MSEKRFTPHSGGHDGDTAQINEHLNDMTAEELIDDLLDKWDAMSDKNFDSQLLDTYLATLDEKDPMAADFDAEASLAAFRKKHSQLFQQMEPVNISLYTQPKHRRRSRWFVVRLTAAIVAVMLGCIVTAQAIGLDVFGIIARWTKETFHFSASSSTGSGETSTYPTGAIMQYGSIQDALNAYGIKDLIAPNWYPDGFQMKDCKISPSNDSIKFQAAYKNGEKFFAITVWQYASETEAGNLTFEKDASDVIIYEYDGVKHYLMSNNNQMRAAWTSKNITCSISGDLSKEELQNMIKSIYER